MRILFLIAATLIHAATPGNASETAWQEVAPGVSMRLISAGSMSGDGKSLFALEIEMPEDTRTYWRVPGETGLPTTLDFSASTGVVSHNQLWPLPRRDESQGYLDYVYFGHTVLPFEVTVSDPAGRVDVQATLGICSEVCVPAQARLALPIMDAETDSANSLRIRQALASVPITWDHGTEPVGNVHLVDDGASIAVEIDSSVMDLTSLIVASASGGPLFGAPQKSPQDKLVSLPIIGKTDNSELEGMEVELYFTTSAGAYEVSRTIKVGNNAHVDASMP